MFFCFGSSIRIEVERIHRDILKSAVPSLKNRPIRRSDPIAFSIVSANTVTPPRPPGGSRREGGTQPCADPGGPQVTRCLPSADPGPPPLADRRLQAKFRTKLCVHWAESGACPFDSIQTAVGGRAVTFCWRSPSNVCIFKYNCFSQSADGPPSSTNQTYLRNVPGFFQIASTLRSECASAVQRVLLGPSCRRFRSVSPPRPSESNCTFIHGEPRPPAIGC